MMRSLGSFITGGSSLSEEAQASRAVQNGQPAKGPDAQTFPIGTHYFGALNSRQLKPGAEPEPRR